MDNPSLFIIEYPDLEYDREGLFDYQNQITDWHPNDIFSKMGIDTSTTKFFDKYVDPTASVVLLKTFLALDEMFELGDPPMKFTKVLTGGMMPYHIDPSRDCILMLPLTDDPSEIAWMENDVIIYKHVYKCPTVINGKILHGVPSTSNDRILLQCKINCNWEVLQKSHKSGVDTETK